jgi:predicted transposase/invertase (TIGR01784 family)
MMIPNSDMRARIEYREKARRDHATLLHAAVIEGEAQGEARGEARGKAQRRMEIVANMKKRGLSIDQIAEYTGISVGEIAKL